MNNMHEEPLQIIAEKSICNPYMIKIFKIKCRKLPKNWGKSLGCDAGRIAA